MFVGRENAAVIFEPVTRFNTKTFAVVMTNLVGSKLNPMYNINQMTNTVLPFESFMIGTNNVHLTSDRAMSGAVDGVGSVVAFASYEQFPSTTSFAMDDDGHDERDIKGL